MSRGGPSIPLGQPGNILKRLLGPARNATHTKLELTGRLDSQLRE